MARLHDHEFFQQAQAGNENSWKAWTNLLNSFMTPSADPPTFEEFNYVTDALRFHIAHQLPRHREIGRPSTKGPPGGTMTSS